MGADGFIHEGRITSSARSVAEKEMYRLHPLEEQNAYNHDNIIT